MTPSFAESQSFKNGSWLPLHELAWSVTDLGTTHGAMLVERLRTFDGRLVDIDDHLTRFADGAERLGIAWPPRDLDIHEICVELVDRNEDLKKHLGDVGLVLLLSPGDPGMDRRQTLVPTMLGHLTPLPFSQLSSWYQNGAALHFSAVRNVPPECWSPSIKTRSRLQYYLADRHIPDPDDCRPQSAIEGASHSKRSPESVAVLLNIHNHVTETSISNLLVLGKDGVLRSPPSKDILWGTSLKSVCQLANSIGQPVEFVDMHPSDMLDAEEILMTGSTGCLWSAVSVDGYPIGDGRPGRLCGRLQEAWQQKIGFSFIEQANQRNG